jgi:hypothetical protein
MCLSRILFGACRRKAGDSQERMNQRFRLGGNCDRKRSWYTTSMWRSIVTTIGILLASIVLFGGQVISSIRSQGTSVAAPAGQHISSQVTSTGIFNTQKSANNSPYLASPVEGTSTSAWVSSLNYRPVNAFSDWEIQNGSVVFRGAGVGGVSLIDRTLNVSPQNFLISTINSGYGKSESTVYYDGAPIAGANPNTFTVLGSAYRDARHYGGYAKDKLNAYYEDSGSSGTIAPIPAADASSFTSLGYGYATDSRSVYYFGNVIPGADPQTFVILGLADSPEGPYSDDTYAKDKDRVFLDGQVLPPNGIAVPSPSYDAESFHLVYDSTGEPTGYAEDKNHVYNAYDATVVTGADPKTFVVLSPYYAKDKFNVYSYGAPSGDSVGDSAFVLRDGNTAAFHLVSGNSSYDAVDGETKYEYGWQIN